MPSLDYAGGELELFADAHNWKAYFSAVLAPQLRGCVLEVGAGLGSTTLALCSPAAKSWDCLEPDAELNGKLTALLGQHNWPCPVRARIGTLGDLARTELFDTIIYIDVLEHIANDRAELAAAVSHLAPGGRLVVLAPAFQFLFSEFDASVGHHRRYTKPSLLALAPPGLTLFSCRYLDSVGLMASLANRMVLRASLPTPKQIRTWDRLMVPLSRILDKVACYKFGRSIIAVWSKP